METIPYFLETVSNHFQLRFFPTNWGEHRLWLALLLHSDIYKKIKEIVLWLTYQKWLTQILR